METAETHFFHPSPYSDTITINVPHYPFLVISGYEFRVANSQLDRKNENMFRHALSYCLVHNCYYSTRLDTRLEIKNHYSHIPNKYRIKIYMPTEPFGSVFMCIVYTGSSDAHVGDRATLTLL